MPSLDAGKEYVCSWIRKWFRTEARILDVGACDGKWRQLLPEYRNMDAVEAWGPNCEKILHMYRKVFYQDIRDFVFAEAYDLIIFGDVIEHMPVRDAQKVLRTAKAHCRDLIVGVPFLWPQDAYDGNPYEVHIQSDLTPELFAERYPWLEILLRPEERYCYYHKRSKE